jgi:hypothetical protein
MKIISLTATQKAQIAALKLSAEESLAAAKLARKTYADYLDGVAGIAPTKPGTPHLPVRCQITDDGNSLVVG